MKTRILPTILGVVGIATLAGLFGHSLEQDMKAAQPVANWQSEKQAMQQAHAQDIVKFTTSLDSANQQLKAAQATNAELARQKKVVCDRLARYIVNIPECKQ